MRISVTILALCRLRNIFHKNREISILTTKKKTTRLTLPQEATERTKQGETKYKTKTRAITMRT
jgi:hypothetical protein